MDDGAPKLPSDLEQPVVTPPVANPPPVTPPTPTPPPVTPPPPPPVDPTPTTPPPADVPEESPEPIKPKSNLKKNLPKIAGGLLVMALLVGGILTGRNLLQPGQTTQVEQQAECKDGTVQLKGTNTITCKGGKKVETKTDAKVLDTLRNLKDTTGINRLDGDTYESQDSLDQAVKFSAVTTSGGAEGGTAQIIITKEESDLLRQKLSNWVNSGKITELRFGGKTYTSAAEMIAEIGKIQEGTSFYFCEGSDAKVCNTTNFEGFISLIDGTGDKCGIIQFDAFGEKTGPGLLIDIPCGGGGERTTEQVPGPSPTPGVSPSPSPTPTPSPNLSCVDLTKDKTSPLLGDSVLFSCEADFSAVSPVAQFRYRIDSGSYTQVPASGTISVDPTTSIASASATINQTGTWEVQCRVCTDASTTSCTAWGQAN